MRSSGGGVSARSLDWSMALARARRRAGAPTLLRDARWTWRRDSGADESRACDRRVGSPLESAFDGRGRRGPGWRDPDSNWGHHDFQERRPGARLTAEALENRGIRVSDARYQIAANSAWLVSVRATATGSSPKSPRATPAGNRQRQLATYKQEVARSSAHRPLHAIPHGRAESRSAIVYALRRAGDQRKRLGSGLLMPGLSMHLRRRGTGRRG